MRDFKSVSDDELISQIRIDAANERRSGLAVIHQLREISRRRLDAKLKYSSLHKFCMEDLKYSSGSAWRRIKAMQALEDVPELEARIAEGELTLANVSQVQSFRDQKDKSVGEKRGIFEQVSGLSKRETERVLASIAPLPERPEKIRALDENKTELRVTLDAETLVMLDQVRDLMAHARPGASYSEVISYLAKLGLKKLDPAAERASRKAQSAQSARRARKGEKAFQETEKSTAPVSFPLGENSPATTRNVPAATRREVWKRDQGKCGYVNAENGQVCGETAFLQLDHIVPWAKGGGHEAGNLRLRCRTHNLLAAVDEFGAEKMRPYLKRGGFVQVLLPAVVAQEQEERGS